MKNIMLIIFAVIMLLMSLFFINNNISSTLVNNKDTKLNVEHNIQDSNSYNSHLPIVKINTDAQTILSEVEKYCYITIIDNLDGKNYFNDKYSVKSVAKIKHRGNSSLNFEKKQYKIEFYKSLDDLERNNITVMGMPKECDWILYGPYLDRTLLRNNIMYNISREIMGWSPETKYCEVFINGVYQGIYLMTESVKVAHNRINLNDFGLISGQHAYMIERERANDNNSNFINNFGKYAGKTYHDIAINYPSVSQITENQKKWISDDVSEFERVLYSNYFDNNIYGYQKYIDVDSFVDYYIINEFAMLRDAGYLSTYVYKDLSGKMKMTVWDFNNSFNNYMGFEIGYDEFCVCNNNWYKRLFQDSNFTEKVIKRYYELRKDTLSDEKLLSSIDTTVKYLGDAIDRNFEVWGNTFNKNLLVGREEPKNYKEAVNQLKECILKRGKFLDDNIKTLYQHAIN